MSADVKESVKRLNERQQQAIILSADLARVLNKTELGGISKTRAISKLNEFKTKYPSFDWNFEILGSTQDVIFLKDESNQAYMIARATDPSSTRDLVINDGSILLTGEAWSREITISKNFVEITNKYPGLHWNLFGYSLGGNIITNIVKYYHSGKCNTFNELYKLSNSDKFFTFPVEFMKTYNECRIKNILAEADISSIEAIVIQSGKSPLFSPETKIEGLTEINITGDPISSRSLTFAEEKIEFESKFEWKDPLKNHDLQPFLDEISIQSKEEITQLSLESNEEEITQSSLESKEEEDISIEEIDTETLESKNVEGNMMDLDKINNLLGKLDKIADWKNMNKMEKAIAVMGIIEPYIIYSTEGIIWTELVTKGKISPETAVSAVISFQFDIPFNTILPIVNIIFQPTTKGVVTTAGFYILEQLAITNPLAETISLVIKTVGIIKKLFGLSSKHIFTIECCLGIKCSYEHYKPSWYVRHWKGGKEEWIIRNSFLEVDARHRYKNNAQLIAKNQLIRNTFRITGIPVIFYDNSTKKPISTIDKTRKYYYFKNSQKEWHKVNDKYMTEEEKEYYDYSTSSDEDRHKQENRLKNGREKSLYSKYKNEFFLKAIYKILAYLFHAKSYQDFKDRFHHIVYEKNTPKKKLIVKGHHNHDGFVSASQLQWMHKNGGDQEWQKHHQNWNGVFHRKEKHQNKKKNDNKHISPKEFIEIQIKQIENKLKEKRTKEENKELENYAETNREDYLKKKGEYTRPNIIKRACQDSFLNNTSLSAVCSYTDLTIISSIANSIVYFDREIQMLRQLKMRKYFWMKTKQYLTSFSSIMSTSIVTGEVVTFTTLLPCCDKLSEYSLNNYCIPGISMGTNLLMQFVMGKLSGNKDNEITKSMAFSAIQQSLNWAYNLSKKSISFLKGKSIGNLVAKVLTKYLTLFTGLNIFVNPAIQLFVGGIVTAVITNAVMRLTRYLYEKYVPTKVKKVITRVGNAIVMPIVKPIVSIVSTAYNICKNTVKYLFNKIKSLFQWFFKEEPMKIKQIENKSKEPEIKISYVYDNRLKMYKSICKNNNSKSSKYCWDNSLKMYVLQKN